MDFASAPVKEFRDSSGNLLAVVVDSTNFSSGVHFVTPNELQQQVAVMNRPSGEIIAAHSHLPVPRSLQGTQEVLIILSGQIEADLYDENRKLVESVLLNPGDIIVLVSGGHGFTVCNGARFIEVKQGPYVPGKDKIIFEGDNGSP